MAYTKTNWQDLPNTTTPINSTNLNKIETGIGDAHDNIGNLSSLTTTNKSDLVSAVNEVKNKGCADTIYIPTASITNATTSAKDVGITLNVTTTGKPLVVIMSLVGSVTAATVDFYLMMDGNGSRVASTNATSRERNTGFKVYSGLSAGNHTIKISFACSQGTRTATIPAYTTISLVAFEI